MDKEYLKMCDCEEVLDKAPIGYQEYPQESFEPTLSELVAWQGQNSYIIYCNRALSEGGMPGQPGKYAVMFTARNETNVASNDILEICLLKTWMFISHGKKWDGEEWV